MGGAAPGGEATKGASQSLKLQSQCRLHWSRRLEEAEVRSETIQVITSRDEGENLKILEADIRAAEARMR